MKHEGKAQEAALKLILLTLIAVLALLVMSFLAKKVAIFVLGLSSVLIVVWVLFALFTFYFFRDPEPQVPTGTGLVVSPAHATVDAIETVTEPEFMGGECQRISMFLSILDVHVQRAPASGRVVLVKHNPGQYLSALKAESARHNENVLLGFETTEPRGEKIGVRLIAGVLARRIIPWVETGDQPSRGERISLIQFGSRADVYLSRRARIQVRLGDKVVGGESVLATFE